jgi:hypothetical protein
MTIGNVRGRSRIGIAKRSRVTAVISLIIVAGGSACGGSPSTPAPSSQDSAAASVSPACSLMTTAQASSILERAAVVVPVKPIIQDESSCSWHTQASAGRQSINIFLHHSVGAVQAFKSSLARPQNAVRRIAINGTPALWRPYATPGGNAFVSAATNGSLIAVEAEGGTNAVDRAAKRAMDLALNSVRSHTR